MRIKNSKNTIVGVGRTNFTKKEAVSSFDTASYNIYFYFKSLTVIRSSHFYFFSNIVTLPLVGLLTPSLYSMM